MPSSKIYATLERLAGKGVVHATTRGTANAFTPVAPAELIDRLRGRFNDPLDLLADQLPRLTRAEEATPLLGVTGLARVLDTARAIIGGATAPSTPRGSADVGAPARGVDGGRGRRR